MTALPATGRMIVAAERPGETAALAQQAIGEMARGLSFALVDLRRGAFMDAKQDVIDLIDLVKLADRSVADLVRENARLRRGAAS